MATTKSASSKTASKSDKEPTAEEREGVVTRTLGNGRTETVLPSDDPNRSLDTSKEREQASSSTTNSGKGEATLV